MTALGNSTPIIFDANQYVEASIDLEFKLENYIIAGGDNLGNGIFTTLIAEIVIYDPYADHNIFTCGCPRNAVNTVEEAYEVMKLMEDEGFEGRVFLKYNSGEYIDNFDIGPRHSTFYGSPPPSYPPPGVF